MDQNRKDRGALEAREGSCAWDASGCLGCLRPEVAQASHGETSAR